MRGGRRGREESLFPPPPTHTPLLLWGCPRPAASSTEGHVLTLSDPSLHTYRPKSITSNSTVNCMGSCPHISNLSFYQTLLKWPRMGAIWLLLEPWLIQWLKEALTLAEIHKANRHMERCSTVLWIMETPNKTKGVSFYTPWIGKNQPLIVKRSGKKVEEWELP